MVKLFIGNLANNTTIEELRALFEKYGTVKECDILKNFGFVHMSNMAEAEEAIRNLHQTELNGWAMNVELSKGKPRASAKLHVTNLSEEVTTEQLWAQFEEFGPVLECDIVKTYAFVHMARMEDALEAINKLDNKAFQGKLMKVQMSTSRLRTAAGMGDYKGCYVCGKQGHWWKSCPNDKDGDGARSQSSWFPPDRMASPPAADYRSSSVYSQASYSGRLPPPPPPPPRFSSYGSNQGGWYTSRAAGSYTDRSAVYSRNHLYSSVDYYEKYKAHYGSSQMEKRYMSYIPPPPPPSSSLSKLTSSANPYDRRPLAPPSSAAVYYTREPITHAPSSSSSSAGVYYTREPITHATSSSSSSAGVYYTREPLTQAPSSSTSYILERKRLSPQPASRSFYPALRPKDPYAQRYAPY